MKKYIIITLCILGYLNAAEQQIIPAAKWNAQEYNDGNKVQELAFLSFVKKHNIKFDETQRVLDVGSGTGNLTYKIARLGSKVHGFDPDEGMINFSRNNYLHKNLTFEKQYAENFTSQEKFNFAIGSFSFHWFHDKPRALQRICECLAAGGHYFFTAHTSEDPKPLNLVVGEEIMESPIVSTIKSVVDLFQTNKQTALGSSYPTREELKTMIENAGFDILVNQQESFQTPLNREEIAAFHRPIVMSRPMVASVPELLKEPLFVYFINKIIEKMESTADGKFMEKLTTTIILAQKK